MDYVGWLTKNHYPQARYLCKLNNISVKNTDHIIELLTTKNTGNVGMTDVRNDNNLVGFCIYYPNPYFIKVKALIYHPEYLYDILINRMIGKLTSLKRELFIPYITEDYEQYELAEYLRDYGFDTSVSNNGFAKKTYESTLII